MKPAVGFTLPSAGVTPAPSEKVKSEKREMLRTTFRSGFLILVAQASACDFLVHADPRKNHRLKPVPRADAGNIELIVAG